MILYIDRSVEGLAFNLHLGYELAKYDNRFPLRKALSHKRRNPVIINQWIYRYLASYRTYLIDAEAATRGGGGNYHK